MELNNITVIDFETSGLDPIHDRVIEMAAIRCARGEIISQFCTLIKFEGYLSPKISEITGITPQQLQNGVDEDTAFRILNRMIGDNVIVAHNAVFDLQFLHFALKRLAGRTFKNDFIDTLAISRIRHPYPHDLKSMCKRYQISFTNGHRALNDVFACWELLKKFNTEKSVSTEVNKIVYTSKYGLPDWYPSHAKTELIEIKYA